jgi:hypothetical protein
MLLDGLGQGEVLASAAHDGRQTTEIGRSSGAAERNDRPQGVAAMAASAILLGDDAQDSCTSLSEVIGDLDYHPAQDWQGSLAVRTGALLGFCAFCPTRRGQPRGWLGVLVVADKHLVWILVQLGLERDGQ